MAAGAALRGCLVAGSSIAGIGGAAAGVEQRHRHLEGAEHDHDHARADQQRADFRGDAGGGALVRPWAWPQPSPWRRCRSCRLSGRAAAAWAARRAAAMKLDVLTGSFGPVLISPSAFLGSSDPLRRRGHPRARPGAGLERMIRRQFRLDRGARRGVRHRGFR